MSNYKRYGQVNTKVIVGKDAPTEEFEMIETNDLVGYEGPIGETGVLLSMTIPLPAPAGQKMSPWAKMEVNVSMPCANNPENLRKVSEFCEKFAQERLSEITKKLMQKVS